LGKPPGFDNHTRPREIFDFLQLAEVSAELAKPGAGWAAVDDMDLVAQLRDLAAKDAKLRGFGVELQQRFVRTNKNWGLDTAGAGKLIQILNGS